MSRMTRDDLIEMRLCANRPGASLITKAQEQAEIERHKAEFVARGGRIQGIPFGVSGDPAVIRLSGVAKKFLSGNRWMGAFA